jgi:hypothetical protein
MALYQKEMTLKQSTNVPTLFINEEVDASKSSRVMERSSEYSGGVLKYPTCDTTKVLINIKE